MKTLAHMRDLIVEALNRRLMAEPNNGMLGGLKARAAWELKQTLSDPAKPLSGYGRAVSRLGTRLSSVAMTSALA